MKLKLEPLLIAAAVGAAILIVSGLMSLYTGYRSMENMLNSPIFDPQRMEELETIDPSTDDPFEVMFGESFQSMMVLSGVANFVQCLGWLLAGSVAGALYVILYRRQDPMAQGNEAGVGAASGALAVIIGYLITAIISTLVISPIMNDFMAQSFAMSGPEAAEAFSQMGTFMVLFIAVGALCGIIIYGAIGGALGALGGVIGNAIVKPQA